MRKIVVSGIDKKGSISDGPGVRTVVFFQGCDRRCPGCHNRSTWNIENGVSMEVSQLANMIKKCTPNKKVTISGGEPLMQAAAVRELIKALKDFDIALYTSYELDEVPKDILAGINHIKVGRFVEQLKTTTQSYAGSSNQKFISLKTTEMAYIIN